MTYALIFLTLFWPALLPIPSSKTEPQIVIMPAQTPVPEYSYDQPIDPKQYLVRPGEILTVTFLGTNIEPLVLTIGSDGRLVSANVGIFDLAGKTLTTVRELLAGPIQQQYSAKAIDISVGPPRNISVQVTGAVVNPGYYSGLSSQRVSEILTLAGGIRATGSRRYITYRAPEAEYPVDLDKSRYLGQLAFDPPIYIGTEIHVPETFAEKVQILGEVQAPREIELVNGDNLDDLLSMAGGVTPSGNRDQAYIVRGTTQLEASASILQNGDIVVVPPRMTVNDTSVMLIGEVKQPGRYSYADGLSLEKLLSSAGGLTEQGNGDRTAVFRLSEKLAWSRGRPIRYAVERPAEGLSGIILQPGDSVIVPHRLGYVRVSGAVRNPGYFAYHPKGTVAQYLAAAGGPTINADRQNILLIDALTGVSTLSSSDTEAFDGDEVSVPLLPAGQ